MQQGRRSDPAYVTMVKDKFIRALDEHGGVESACSVVGISRQTAYHWRTCDDEFGAAWADVVEKHKGYTGESSSEHSAQWHRGWKAGFDAGVLWLQGRLAKKGIMVDEDNL